MHTQSFADRHPIISTALVILGMTLFGMLASGPGPSTSQSSTAHEAPIPWEASGNHGMDP